MREAASWSDGHTNNFETPGNYGADVPAQPTSFAVGPEETNMSVTGKRATDMVPEVPPPLAETPPKTSDTGGEAPVKAPKPVAQVTERPRRDEFPTAYFISRPDEPLHSVEVSPEQDAELNAKVSELYGGVKQKVFDTFHSKQGGLDIARGDAFMRRLGIPVTDATLELPMSQQDAVFETIKRAEQRKGTGQTAIYAPTIDTVFTFRNPELEAMNGPEITEVKRIHELTHSSGRQALQAVDEGTGETTVSFRRNGWLERSPERGAVEHNFFFNEGVAEYVAAKYTVEELGMQHGLARVNSKIALVESGWGKLTEVPSQYAYLNPNGDVMATAPAFAAAGLGLLIARDPALEGPLLHGAHDEEAYEEAIGRINAIRPGLYEELGADYNAYTWLPNGLWLIEGALGQ